MNGGFLNDRDLTDAALAGQPFVDPFDAEAIRAASIDLRVGNERYEYSFTEYKLGDDIRPADVVRSSYDEIWIEPGQSAYIGLLEEIQIPLDALGFVFPRSSLTRLGIAIFPVYMNPGYKGQMPLTIANHGHARVCIVPGARVAQLLCAKLSEPVLAGYGNQTAAKYHQERVSAAKPDDDDFSAVLERVIRARMPQLAKP
jgi:dCTP deaminase